VTAAAFVACADPERLARAMARHFGHKVPVTTDGGITGVELRMGSFELEPADGGLAVRASAQDEAQLADVRRIAGDHLARFARPEPIDITWDQASLIEGER
jgi:hypothetical protein